MKKLILLIPVLLVGVNFISCRKDKISKDPAAMVHFSTDSVLFDTVFTTIGSSTRQLRVINKNKQRINISSIRLQNGAGSQFFLNVDGSPGRSFSDVEIAGNDSMYIFVQVNVDPANGNSPLIISDAILFNVNGKEQSVVLEAWGQDAYYHRPDRAIKFSDGSYLAYSRIAENNNANVVWKKDKPHVIFGYLVVDSSQKLTIEAGVRVYLNYKAGLWVYQYGQLRVLGAKGNEVIFQGARREKEFTDEPGQWDRIWINEGSQLNEINYAIIKNGFIGIQAELFGDSLGNSQLTLTNTKIQNMSRWGLYCLFYRVLAGNNVISNCQEHLVNIPLGGVYGFYHNTFVNYWNKEKSRDKPAINLMNHSESQTVPLIFTMSNCVIDGKLENELNVDIKTGVSPLEYSFRNCWIKTNINTSSKSNYLNIIKATSSDTLKYKDIGAYNFEPAKEERKLKAFTDTTARNDTRFFPSDIKGINRNTFTVTAGAYEIQ